MFNIAKTGGLCPSRPTWIAARENVRNTRYVYAGCLQICGNTRMVMSMCKLKGSYTRNFQRRSEMQHVHTKLQHETHRVGKGVYFAQLHIGQRGHNTVVCWAAWRIHFRTDKKQRGMLTQSLQRQPHTYAQQHLHNK